MAVLQLKDLLQRLDGGAKSTVLTTDTEVCVTRYAAEVWTSCRLDGVAPSAIQYCARTAADLLCHLNVGRKDCFLVVVCPLAGGPPTGHLLFDIGAEYRPAEYQNLSTGFVGQPTEEMLADSLPRLGEGGTPAAILDCGGGTYLQTYRDAPDRYALEYQLMTTAFHFVAVAPITTRDVQRAFQSYAFGKYEWAREFTWQHQPL